MVLLVFTRCRYMLIRHLGWFIANISHSVGPFLCEETIACIVYVYYDL